MSWLTITADQVLSRMTLTERTQCDTDDVNAGEPSRLDTIITYVTEMVRGKVAQAPYVRARMGPTGTVPSELFLSALNIIRFELFTALPLGDTLLDKNRISDYEN